MSQIIVLLGAVAAGVLVSWLFQAPLWLAALAGMLVGAIGTLGMALLERLRRGRR